MGTSEQTRPRWSSAQLQASRRQGARQSESLHPVRVFGARHAVQDRRNEVAPGLAPACPLVIDPLRTGSGSEIAIFFIAITFCSSNLQFGIALCSYHISFSSFKPGQSIVSQAVAFSPWKSGESMWTLSPNEWMRESRQLDERDRKSFLPAVPSNEINVIRGRSHGIDADEVIPLEIFF